MKLQKTKSIRNIAFPPILPTTVSISIRLKNSFSSLNFKKSA